MGYFPRDILVQPIISTAGVYPRPVPSFFLFFKRRNTKSQRGKQKCGYIAVFEPLNSRQDCTVLPSFLSMACLVWNSVKQCRMPHLDVVSGASRSLDPIVRKGNTNMFRPILWRSNFWVKMIECWGFFPKTVKKKTKANPNFEGPPPARDYAWGNLSSFWSLQTTFTWKIPYRKRLKEQHLQEHRLLRGQSNNKRKRFCHCHGTGLSIP